MTEQQIWSPLEIETELAAWHGGTRRPPQGDGRRTGRTPRAGEGPGLPWLRGDPGALDDVLDLLLPNRLAYVHGNSPRTKVGSNVYTSTEYPQEFTISMHNEMSYAHAW